MDRGELALRATFSVLLFGICACGVLGAVYAPPSVPFGLQIAMGALFVLVGILTQFAAWVD
jgi:hypothetical protein